MYYKLSPMKNWHFAHGNRSNVFLMILTSWENFKYRNHDEWLLYINYFRHTTSLSGVALVMSSADHRK